MGKLVNFTRSQKNRYADLRDEIEEERKFLNEGFDRIERYYELPPERREKETGLKPRPHEMIRQFSEDFVSLGISSDSALGHLPDYLLVGMGTELLLKAIILKERPKIFIEKRNKLKFERCKHEIIKLLRENFSPKQVRRIEDVLTLIQLRRNNLAHLGGFHRLEVYMFPYQMANVLEFLYNHFFPETSQEILAKLGEFKRERKVVSGRDYEPVEFGR